jgi:hypothetical protein
MPNPTAKCLDSAPDFDDVYIAPGVGMPYMKWETSKKAKTASPAFARCISGSSVSK